MVFIQPTILRDSQTANHYTNDRYNYLRNLQLQNQSPVQLMPGEMRRLLNEMKPPAIQPPPANTPTPAASTAAPAANTRGPPLPAQVTRKSPVPATPPQAGHIHGPGR